ncbi:hypothetical protein A4X13_0g8783 [Tilletia indica]|uniref:Uncharacterized protein n=1 Tax=Tilletia indica TaxID=43049 RepID=A0A177TS63_9BASI|nr:hypothetical protein A4X13_0g8783 [Tilletia indica]
MDEFLAANQALREAIDRYDAAARALGMRPDWIEVIRQIRAGDATGPVFPEHAPPQQPGQEQLQQPASTRTPSTTRISQQFTCVEIPRTSLSSLLGPPHPLPTIANAEEPARERRSGGADGRSSSKKRKKSTSSTSNVDTVATTGNSLVIAIDNKPCKHEFTSGGWRHAFRGQPFKSAPVCAACYQSYARTIQRKTTVPKASSSASGSSGPSVSPRKSVKETVRRRSGRAASASQQGSLTVPLPEPATAPSPASASSSSLHISSASSSASGWARSLVPAPASDSSRRHMLELSPDP